MPRSESETADRFAAVREQVEAFDQAAFVASVAGLNALPVNAGRRVRLDVLTEVAASKQTRLGNRQPRRKDLERIINGDALASLLPVTEDPPQFPFTEPIFFEDRFYVAFGSVWSQMVGQTEALVAAYARQQEDPHLGAPESRALILAVLEIGDATAQRLGIDAGVEPGSQQFVSVPASFAELAASVTWKREDLAQLLGPKLAGLDRLCIDLDSFSPGALPENGVLDFRPLIRLPDRSLIVLPGSLLRALTHALLCIAREGDFLDRVQAGLVASSLASVRESTWLIQAELQESAPQALALGATPPPSLYDLDDRAAMVVVPLAAPLEAFDPDVEPQWDSRETLLDFDKRWRAIADWALASGSGYDELLLVGLLIAPANWTMHLGLTDMGSSIRQLVTDASDLLVMSYFERGEPLGLLRFARSVDALPGRLLTWSPLDEYAIYMGKKSFYLSDGPRPTFVSFSVGSGLKPRLEYLGKRRLQAAEMESGQRVLLEARYEETSPVFVPRYPISQPVRVVRFPGTDVWLLGRPLDQMSPTAASIMFDAIEAAAYWVWQVAPVVLTAAPVPRSTITVFLDIDDDQAWESADIPDVAPSPSDIAGGVDMAKGEIYIRLESSLRASLHRADNMGERHLALVLADAIARLATDDNGLGVEMMDQVLEAVGPPSQRKMMLLLTPEKGWRIGSDEGLPAWRKISDWHDGRLRDQLADELAKAGYKAGPPGDADEQNKLLKFAVNLLFDRLERMVAELNPDGIIEELLLRHESTLRKTALDRLLIPTRIACFGEYSDVASTIRREQQEVTLSAIALRFLIEYVAARPPTGIAPLDRDRFDELLALAAMVADLGRWSDVVHFRLGDVRARVLDSGRLGMRPEAIDRGLEKWLSQAFPAEIQAAHDSFADHWTPTNGSGSAPPQVEAAFDAEIGLTLTKLGAVAGGLVDITWERHVDVVFMSPDDLAADLAQRVPVDAARIARALDLLSLRPRAAFLAPQAPFLPQDVYPWRFGRGLSLVRRPLVVWPAANGDLVIWGRRAVHLAYVQLVGSYLYGQATPHTRAMELLRSNRSEAAGKAFPRQVAETLSLEGLSAHERVKRFGRLRLQADQGDLGDIDVLAIDETRRILWSIECKNVQEARTPWELASELAELHDPTRGIVARHLRRERWLRRNLSHVLDTYVLSGPGWQVRSLIVTSTELVGPHISTPPIPVVSIHRLRGVIASARPQQCRVAKRPKRKLGRGRR